MNMLSGSPKPSTRLKLDAATDKQEKPCEGTKQRSGQQVRPRTVLHELVGAANILHARRSYSVRPKKGSQTSSKTRAYPKKSLPYRPLSIASLGYSANLSVGILMNLPFEYRILSHPISQVQTILERLVYRPQRRLSQSTLHSYTNQGPEHAACRTAIVPVGTSSVPGCQSRHR